MEFKIPVLSRVKASICNSPRSPPLFWEGRAVTRTLGRAVPPVSRTVPKNTPLFQINCPHIDGLPLRHLKTRDHGRRVGPDTAGQGVPFQRRESAQAKIVGEPRKKTGDTPAAPVVASKAKPGPWVLRTAWTYPPGTQGIGLGGDLKIFGRNWEALSAVRSVWVSASRNRPTRVPAWKRVIATVRSPFSTFMGTDWAA